jgi:hypothetical protein
MGFDSTTYRTPQYAFSETSSVDIPASASDTSDDVPQDEYDTTNDDTEDPSTHFSEAKVADLRKVQESRELAAMWADKLQFQTCLLQLKMLSIDKTESQSEVRLV